MSCPTSDLDAFVRSELPANVATGIAAHLEGCQACRYEASWLRAEIALARHHAAAEPASTETLWNGIALRIASPPRSPRNRATRWAPFAAIIPAAAVLILAIRTQPSPRPGQSPKPAETALQRSLDAVSAAEQDYRSAVDQLEAEYRIERSHLEPEEAMRWDATLDLARTRLGEARLAASSDVDSQMKVLRGYSAYVHTLHRAVTELQETGK
jgi:hypothetical protein